MQLLRLMRNQPVLHKRGPLTTNWEEQAGTSRARKEVLHRKELGQPGAPSLLPHTWPSPPPPEATPPTHHLSSAS